MTEPEFTLDSLDQAAEDAAVRDRLTIEPAGNPYDTAREVTHYLAGANAPARLFRMGSAAVLLLPDGVLEPFDGDAWMAYILQRVNFIGQKGQPLSTPPQIVMRITAKLLHRKLPPLDGVISAPYLTADGTLITDDGYNPDTRLILRTGDLKLPDVSDQPSDEEVVEAIRLLRWDWLGDFPFASEADAANAIAELLTITGREMFALVPLLVHDASAPGSGKGLLLDVLSIVASGKPAHITELPADREEQRKTILSVLLSGQLIVAWDELHIIEGTSLAAILTAENYTARVLGISKMVEVRNKLIQVALGNNVEVRGDMKRRVNPLRLVPDTSRPEQRTGFRNPDLKEWTAEHRAELLAAAFTLWRNWIAKGRKPADLTMGSFDRWARTIGGVLQAAGTHSFMSNKQEWLTYSEDDGDDWYSHLRGLRIYFRDRWFTAQAAADAVNAASVPRPPVKVDPDRELRTLIGYGYRKIRDRWHADLRLIRSTERDSEEGAYTWRIEQQGAPCMTAGSISKSPVSPVAQVKGMIATGDTGDALSAAWVSPGISSASPVPDRPLTWATGDTEHSGDGSSAPHGEDRQPAANVTNSDRPPLPPEPADYLDDDLSGWGPGTIGAAENPSRRVRCPNCRWQDRTLVPPGGKVTCKRCANTFTG